MKRMRIVWLILLALPAALLGQEPDREPRAGAPTADRRAALEQRLYDRFLEHAAGELGLDAGGRERLGAVIRETAQSRRELAREGLEVRRELVKAVRDSTTSDAEIRQLLSRLDAMRERELRIWQGERSRLAEFLTPRQQAAYLGLRARFNDWLLEFRHRRRPGARDRMPGWSPPGVRR